MGKDSDILDGLGNLRFRLLKDGTLTDGLGKSVGSFHSGTFYGPLGQTLGQLGPDGVVRNGLGSTIGHIKK